MVESNLNHAVRDQNVQDSLYLKKVLYISVVQLRYRSFSVYGSRLDFSDI